MQLRTQCSCARCTARPCCHSVVLWGLCVPARRPPPPAPPPHTHVACVCAGCWSGVWTWTRSSTQCCAGSPSALRA
jgi:hypothetical protein